MRDPANVRQEYEEQIIDWQERVKKEGWTNRTIKSIYRDAVSMTTYKFDDVIPGQRWPGDHWDTPDEFIENGLAGDCEDISGFIWSTFKRLKYPYQIRILGVMAMATDHALGNIELSNGEWLMLESVQANSVFGEWIFYRPFAEWDINQIYNFGS